MWRGGVPLPATKALNSRHFPQGSKHRAQRPAGTFVTFETNSKLCILRRTRVRLLHRNIHPIACLVATKTIANRVILVRRRKGARFPAGLLYAARVVLHHCGKIARKSPGTITTAASLSQEEASRPNRIMA
jgi:hypothetical protein